jgi:uncharacterized protein RhaS with RHS repeats
LIFELSSPVEQIHQLEGDLMDIYHAINATIQTPPQDLIQAQGLLAQYPLDAQTQLITAIYLGRDHIHNTEMRDDTDWTRRAIDHIPVEDYAQIVYEKASSDSAKTYLQRLLLCSRASGYDLGNM